MRQDWGITGEGKSRLSRITRPWLLLLRVVLLVVEGFFVCTGKVITTPATLAG